MLKLLQLCNYIIIVMQIKLMLLLLGWRIPLSKGLQWRIQGRSPGPRIIFRPNCGPKGRKNFLGESPPPPYLWVWMTGPPPYLKVWIRHWIIQNSKLKMRIKYCDKHFFLFSELWNLQDFHEKSSTEVRDCRSYKLCC